MEEGTIKPPEKVREFSPRLRIWVLKGAVPNPSVCVWGGGVAVGGVPHTTELGVLYHLTGNNIRRHRLRGQSHKTALPLASSANHESRCSPVLLTKWL